MDTANAKIPAISICGFLDKSNLERNVFSGNASASAIAALESNWVFDKFKLCKQGLRAKAVFKVNIYGRKKLILLLSLYILKKILYALICFSSKWVI